MESLCCTVLDAKDWEICSLLTLNWDEGDAVLSSPQGRASRLRQHLCLTLGAGPRARPPTGLFCVARWSVSHSHHVILLSHDAQNMIEESRYPYPPQRGLVNSMTWA